jgi:hypothetical protein
MGRTLPSSSFLSAGCLALVGVLALLASNVLAADKVVSAGGTTVNHTAVAYPWDLSWVAGVEYTPARAPGNSLWWNKYAEYRPDVERELAWASNLYGFNHLRMFLHDMVFDIDSGATLFAAMNDFLAIAATNGFKVSFVFFDDCWNHAGASLEEACTPVKGRHNGCWMAIPQDVDRTSVDRFKSYVYDTVYRFADDDRVAFWEIFNEPQNSNDYSMSLRHTAFQWAQDALKDAFLRSNKAADYVQKVPVLSCWDNNIDTQISDMHRYDTNFVDWTKQVFVGQETMNTLITEGGSRWYQGYPSDAGSPLTVLHWYHHLKSITPSVEAPFNFGIVLNWELMVGESNTRWHWDTPDDSPEPVIPWDAHLFPDGSAVSYVEAAVIRNWTLGSDDLVVYENFLPDTHAFTDDRYLCLGAHQGYAPTQKVVSVNASDIVIVETAVWPSESLGGGVLIQLREADSDFYTGLFVGFPNGGSSKSLTIESWKFTNIASTTKAAASVSSISVHEKTVLNTFDMMSLDCGLVMDGWNLLRLEFSLAEQNLNVFANPMYPEAASTSGIQPRLSHSFSVSGLESVKDIAGSVLLVGSSDDATVTASETCTRFDYIGVLPKTPSSTRK